MQNHTLAIGDRLRRLEGVQQRAGLAVEQVSSPSTRRARVIQKRADEDVIPDRRHRDPEPLALGRLRLVEALQQLPRAAIKEVRAPGGYSADVVERRADEEVRAGGSDRG